MSTVKCSDPKPGESLKKSATSKESDSEDPIFLPHNRPYTVKEEYYIFSLTPLKILPVSLLPTAEYPRPPCMHYGWILTDEIKERLMKKAHEAQVVMRRSAYVPCSKEEDPIGYKKVYTDIDKRCTLHSAIKYILKELGIVLPSRIQFISGVGVLDAQGEVDTEWCFALYSNLQVFDEPLPSARAVARIRAAFGLTGEPRWWPDGRFDWVIHDY